MLQKPQHRKDAHATDAGENILLCWVGKKVHLVFFHKMKDTFFIFTDDYIDLGILSMSAVSQVAEH